ncbi:MAG: diguanylate cyclase, partial [Anaeroplasmataceae bacterium]|nr:diguanylate cyclase [Anaeroplasmataceae bacterium]
AYVSTNYLKLEKIYSVINQLEGTTKFREILRLTLIELSKLISFEESYLLYYDTQYLGFHYKKERVYDKKLNFENIMNTINQYAISQEQEVYLDQDSTENNYNIVDGNVYSVIPFGIAFPLWKEDNVYGSLAFFGTESFLQEPMAYETLRLISQMLNRSLILEMEQNLVRASNKKMFFLYENISSGIKELLDENIHLSYQAKEMLGSLEDTTLHEYSTHIHAEDLPGYMQTLDEVYKSLNPKTITYRFKKGLEYVYIKESLFPSFENGMILIYSLLDNISYEIKIRDELKNLAYESPTTKLSTDLKLSIDLKEYANHRKLSLAVFDVYDFKLYEELYGINFSNQLVYAIAKSLKEVFASHFNISLYHLEADRFAALILDCNDRRTIDHLLENAFQKISSLIYDKNYRVKLFFRCGVYRLSKSINQIDYNKIIQYAYEALSLAKDMKNQANQIRHYDSEEAKIKFNENSLITHISEAIDHNRIGVCYKQIVDITEGEVFAFDAYLSLDNYDIDSSYVKQVIARRGLEEVLNKYLISSASKDLKMLKTSVKGEISILIEVDLKTIDQNFVSFLEAQNSFYKTTKRNLIFHIKDATVKQVVAANLLGYQFASENVLDIYMGTISYFLYDISKGFIVLKDLLKLCDEKKVCFIASNVKVKEEVEQLKELGVKYIYGPYYKKTIRMKKVIEKLA